MQLILAYRRCGDWQRDVLRYVANYLAGGGDESIQSGVVIPLHRDGDV